MAKCRFCKNYLYFVAKKKCWLKLLLSLLLKWNIVGNKPSFFLNLVIIGVANTALLQKFLGANPRFPERLELFPGLGDTLQEKFQIFLNRSIGKVLKIQEVSIWKCVLWSLFHNFVILHYSVIVILSYQDILKLLYWNIMI